MEYHALIMAAGEGHRAGSDIPKQFVELLGIPMLWWSVMAFHQARPDTNIKIVMHPGFFDDFDIMMTELPGKLSAAGLDPALADINVQLVCGGRTRSESVRNGLNSVPDNKETVVAVHDAARPLVSTRIINECWQEACHNEVCAVPVMPVADSLREYDNDETGSTHAVDRSRFVAVQTPQTVRADMLHNAFRQTEGQEFTDEASRIQALYGTDAVKIFNGAPQNMKVTNPDDFAVAEVLLRKTLLKNN